MKEKFILTVLFFCWAAGSHAQTTEKVLTPEKVIKLVPDRIKGFDQNTNPRSKTMQVGALTYSLCEKNFEAGNQSIKILLFDYKEAPIMYDQAMRGWNNLYPVESDSLIQRAVRMTNCTGWESYNKHQKTSLIILGICDRFFLTMTCQNVELETLQEIIQSFQLEKFPK